MDRFGTWSKNPDVVKNWGRADYLINNREIQINAREYFPLKKLTSAKNVVIILTLYALCDLTYENKTKDYFNLSEIKNMIITRIKKYKLFLLTKGNHIIENINYIKFNKTNINYNVTGIIQREKKKLSDFISKYLKPKGNILGKENISMHEIYYSVAFLLGNFVSIKVYIKKDEYSEIYDEPTSTTRVLYYLSPSGKELMKKYREENYLL